MHSVAEYFPWLSRKQIAQFAKLEQLYAVWNNRINVISRQDIANIFERHILFSAGISKYFNFLPGTRIMDAGTGGGFPGIPLAIIFPDSEFCLVDSIAKKIKVVEAIVLELGLKNVRIVRDRFENITEKFDFITARAVMPLTEFCRIVEKNISPVNHHIQPNGIIYLKGGDVKDELSRIDAEVKVYPMAEIFPQLFFSTKKIIHIYKGKKLHVSINKVQAGVGS